MRSVPGYCWRIFQVHLSILSKIQKWYTWWNHLLYQEDGTQQPDRSLNQKWSWYWIQKQYSWCILGEQRYLSELLNRQDSLAERCRWTKKPSIIKAARSMLSEANLATQFWAEAVNHACFTQNRSLIVKGFKKTSYELFHGRKPSISFLHIFGCNCLF